MTCPQHNSTSSYYYINYLPIKVITDVKGYKTSKDTITIPLPSSINSNCSTLEKEVSCKEIETVTRTLSLKSVLVLHDYTYWKLLDDEWTLLPNSK